MRFETITGLTEGECKRKVAEYKRTQNTIIFPMHKDKRNNRWIANIMEINNPYGHIMEFIQHEIDRNHKKTT